MRFRFSTEQLVTCLSSEMREKSCSKGERKWRTHCETAKISKSHGAHESISNEGKRLILFGLWYLSLVYFSLLQLANPITDIKVQIREWSHITLGMASMHISGSYIHFMQVLSELVTRHKHTNSSAKESQVVKEEREIQENQVTHHTILILQIRRKLFGFRQNCQGWWKGYMHSKCITLKFLRACPLQKQWIIPALPASTHFTDTGQSVPCSGAAGQSCGCPASNLHHVGRATTTPASSTQSLHWYHALKLLAGVVVALPAGSITDVGGTVAGRATTTPASSTTARCSPFTGTMQWGCWPELWLPCQLAVSLTLEELYHVGRATTTPASSTTAKVQPLPHVSEILVLQLSLLPRKLCKWRWDEQLFLKCQKIMDRDGEEDDFERIQKTEPLLVDSL